MSESLKNNPEAEKQALEAWRQKVAGLGESFGLIDSAQELGKTEEINFERVVSLAKRLESLLDEPNTEACGTLAGESLSLARSFPDEENKCKEAFYAALNNKVTIIWGYATVLKRGCAEGKGTEDANKLRDSVRNVLVQLGE